MNTRLSLTPSAKNPFGLSAKVLGFSGQSTIHWGDGSAPVHAVTGKAYEHSFPAVGRYMVTCVDLSGVLVARQQITITGSVELPEVYVSGDDTQIRVSFSEPDPRLGASNYRIEWQDGDLEHVWGVPGHTVRHDAVPGVHEVKIVDTFSGRTQSFVVRVVDGPVYEPDFTVHRWPEDPSGMTIYLKLNRVQPGRPIHLWWDDADGPQLVQHPLVGMEIPHIYTYPGHYMQTVAYAGDELPSVTTKSESITVPALGGDHAKHSAAAELQASLSAFARTYGLSRLGLGRDGGLFGVRAGRENAGALEAGKSGAGREWTQIPAGDSGGEPVVADAGSSDHGVEPLIVDGESDGPSEPGSAGV